MKELCKIVQKESTSLKDAMRGFEVLREWDVSEADYAEAARTRWPEATAFQGKAGK